MNTLRHASIACAVLVLAIVAQAQGRRPVTHEDVWLMRRIASPAVSPDGRWIVVGVAEPAYDPKDEYADLWLVRADGSGKPRRLTESRIGEAGPVWNPDSRRIAFYHRLENEAAPQIFVGDIETGEVKKITDVAEGARSPKWSPDGTRIAFIADVHPGAGNDTENRAAALRLRERKTSALVYDGFPVRYWDHWIDVTRPHLLVQDAKPDARPVDLFAGWELAKLPGFAGRDSENAEVIDFAWAPDGRSIVFAATLNRDEAARSVVVNDLFAVGFDGAAPRRLTSDGWSYFEPVFAKTGDWLVVGAAPADTGRVYSQKQLLRFPWPFDQASRIRLADGFDRNPRQPVITPDGAEIVFTAEDGGREKVYRAPSAGGPAHLWIEPGAGVIVGLDAGGKRRPFFAAIFEAANQPPEVVSLSDRRGVQRLTEFNKNRVKGLDLSPAEDFWFTSGKGRRIHSLIVRPAGFDPSRRYPVLVLMHGGPHSMSRDAFHVRWNYHLLAGKDYVVISTNYSGSTGFGEAFAQGLQGDPLKTPAEEILEALDAAVAKYPFMDASRVAAAGASYGGHLAGWMQAATTRFRCLVSHAGLVNIASQWGTSDVIYHRELNMDGPVWEHSDTWTAQNPARFADRNATGEGWVTPMLVTAGERDFRVPINNALETWSYLQRLQVPSRLIVFPDENHWIQRGENSRFWYAEIKAWLDRWTLPAQRPPR